MPISAAQLFIFHNQQLACRQPDLASSPAPAPTTSPKPPAPSPISVCARCSGAQTQANPSANASTMIGHSSSVGVTNATCPSTKRKARRPKPTSTGSQSASSTASRLKVPVVLTDVLLQSFDRDQSISVDHGQRVTDLANLPVPSAPNLVPTSHTAPPTHRKKRSDTPSACSTSTVPSSVLPLSPELAVSTTKPRHFGSQKRPNCPSQPVPASKKDTAHLLPTAVAETEYLKIISYVPVPRKK